MQSFDDDYCWVQNQNYQESSIINTTPQLPFEYSPNMAGATGDAISSPRISSFSTNAAGGGSIFPKSSVGKSIRRRSRASKKAPTTLLNANASNFRALVQQFTGCHSSSAPPAFRSNCKGPINLNFAQYSASNTQKYSYDQDQDQAQPRHHPEQQQYWQQEDQTFFSFGANNIPAVAVAVAVSDSTADHDHEFFVSSTDVNCCNPRRDPLTLDDFDIDHKISLQELSGVAAGEDYCSGTRNDEFWGY